MKEKTVDGNVDPRLDATLFWRPTEMAYGQTMAQRFAGRYADPNRIARGDSVIFWKKYTEYWLNTTDQDWDAPLTFKVLRFADVLLLQAEALNELGQTDAALPFINRVRARVNLAPLPAGMTKEEMRDRILHERLLELADEHQRWLDLERQNLLTTRVPACAEVARPGVRLLHRRQGRAAADPHAGGGPQPEREPEPRLVSRIIRGNGGGVEPPPFPFLPQRSEPVKSLPAIVPLPVLLLLAACAGGNSTAPAQPGGPTTASCTFHDPIGTGQDPWVVRRGDTYHLVESRDGGIWVSRSPRLERVKENGVKVWTPPAWGWNHTNVWAPELHHIGDRWYIYYAAGESGPPYVHQRAGVLESVGDDPQGEYVDRGMLYTGDDPQLKAEPMWAIDLTVGEIGGAALRRVVGLGEQREHRQDAAAPLHRPDVQSVDDQRPAGEALLSGGELGGGDGAEPGGGTGAAEARRRHLHHLLHARIVAEGVPAGAAAPPAGRRPARPRELDEERPRVHRHGGRLRRGARELHHLSRRHRELDRLPFQAQREPGWDRVIRAQPFGWKPDGSPDFGTPVASGVKIDAAFRAV